MKMGFLDRAHKLKKKKFVEIDEKELKKIAKKRKDITIEAHEDAVPKEVKRFQKEVHEGKPVPKNAKGRSPSRGSVPLLSVNIPGFEQLIEEKGLERGNTILVSGGAGSGKTTFTCQSLYNSVVNSDQKAVYISTEEDVDKLKRHMLKNYGWDFYALEDEGKIAFLQLDPIEIARQVEASILKEKKKLKIDFGTLEMPFKPDRLVLDSLSSLSIAFESSEGYRKYLRALIKKFEGYNSLNFMLSETEQDPRVYSRAGVEEFLVDGVIVLYNIKAKNVRQQAMEILKMRSTKHQKKLVPFEMTKDGITIFADQQLFEA
jgi:KaiC/GvpD/RAD55 family RecA-like ATPase